MIADPLACTAVGPALGQAFLRHGLPTLLPRLGLADPDPSALMAAWGTLRPRLGRLGPEAGATQVRQHVLGALAEVLDATLAPGGTVRTREGVEDGGVLLRRPDAIALRCWAVATRTDLDTPARQPRAGRTARGRTAHRVLRAAGERCGLLTNGRELRLLVSDPALADSHLAFPLDAWGGRDGPPASLALLLTLLSAPALSALPAILDAARLHQARVTRTLRTQAREGLELFLQCVIAHPDNPPAEPAALWHDGLILMHRLLFILKLEAEADPARGFSFAATALWRGALSPNTALGPLARRHLDQGHDTGTMLESGLRHLFRACRDGLRCAELTVAPLGGALFQPDAMATLGPRRWGDRAVALLLDRLLWTSPGGQGRERVHYGPLDVEVLGGIYESLLDLEPGIADRPMTRLRRHDREVVVPADAEHPLAVEAIAAGRFFLRAGRGRKASGSYYTPTGFVRYLVAATLGPLCRKRSPEDDPDPAAILALRVVDPATGSGHFLVESCRFLADALFDACRRCDLLARDPATAADAAARYRARLAALPDPDGLLASWLPSLGSGGIAEQRAMALCRRLVAIHCLYGADRNPLAVELAKLALWLESHAEGLPLTFLDHRLVCGDSLAGPFLADLRRLPVGGGPLDPLLARGIDQRLDAMQATVLDQLRQIGATLGRDLADLALKQAAGVRLETARAALLSLARAWAGAAMLARRDGDDEWLALARMVAETGAFPADPTPRQAAMLLAGADALPWDIAFPEAASGFDAVIGNPPWDVIQPNTRDFVADYDLSVLTAPNRRAQAAQEARVLADPAIAAAFAAYRDGFEHRKRIAAALYRHQRAGSGPTATAGNLDAFRLFAERAMQLAEPGAATGLLLPSAFHANEGTTGIRQLYLDNGLATCLSFENRRGIFDIDSRFKFALVIVRRPGPALVVRCGFYLDGLDQAEDPERVMDYDRAFIAASGGAHQTLIELRGPRDQAIARQLLASPERFGAWCTRHGIRLGRDLHMTGDAGMLEPIEAGGAGPGWLILHEGKTFHQYTDQWDTPPRYRVRAEALRAKPLVAAAAAHPRLAIRDIARSTDERSAIATMLPAGVVLGHTATVEKTPDRRPVRAALALCTVLNAFPFDWLVRQKTAAHLSLYLLDPLPMPALSDPDIDHLAAIAASLCARDDRFADLLAPWPGRGFVATPARDGVAGAPAPAFIADPAARRDLRAEADAIVAHRYGLDRLAYEHILSSFSHRSWPDAPAQCLLAFDRFAQGGQA